MNKTNISWCDRTWNPIIGCRKISAGCEKCYAETMARRLNAMGVTGYEKVIGSNGWTGSVTLVDRKIQEPMKRKKPATIFVCSMSDLFCEGVPDEWLYYVWAVMALCPQHTFVVCTKRAERMKKFTRLLHSESGSRAFTGTVSALPESSVRPTRNLTFQTLHSVAMWLRKGSPLQNVVGMVTVENQQAAHERVPGLLNSSFLERWVSIEPMLGPVDLTGYMPKPESLSPRIDGVIVGGETGPNARPMDPDWVRRIRDQCEAACVAFHFKQWGGGDKSRALDGCIHNDLPGSELQTGGAR